MTTGYIFCCRQDKTFNDDYLVRIRENFGSSVEAFDGYGKTSFFYLLLFTGADFELSP